MRLRVAHGIDAAEDKRKAKKSKKGKAKQVFTEVGDGTAEETQPASCDAEDEDIEFSDEEEEEDDHASDNEERVRKST